MKPLIHLITFSITAFSVLFIPFLGYADTEIRFNNENWYTLPHPKVAEFYMQADGSVIGLTENGISFTQYNVPNEYGIRVQRFEIEDHYHYIVEGEIADTFTELSALLAQAYNHTQV